MRVTEPYCTGKILFFPQRVGGSRANSERTHKFIGSMVVVVLILTGLWPGFYDTDDLRSLSEQMAESRANAKRGHQTMLNREAVKRLKPGDLVRFDGKLWRIKFETTWGFRIEAAVGDQCELDPRYESQMTPGRLERVYTRGTSEWKRACEEFVLDLPPVQDPVIGQPTAETSSHL